MKTQVADTSIAAFYDNVHALDAVKPTILAAMEHGKDYTRKEISKMCGIDINCVTGRVNEMVKSGDLEECGTAPRGHKNRSVGVVRLALVLQ